MQKRWWLKPTMPSGQLDTLSQIEAEVEASTVEEAEVQAEETLGAAVGAKVVKVDEVVSVDLAEEIHATHVARQVTIAETVQRKTLSASTVEPLAILSSPASTKK